jgi:hypothetical protein
LLFSVFSFTLLYGQALMLNYLVNEYRMTARQSYLTGMAYLMITSLLPEWNYLSAPLLASTFVIWMFIKLFRLYNSSNARAQVYNIGLLAGISSFIFLPSALVLLLCIILGLMILKPFRLNEMLLSLWWVAQRLTIFSGSISTSPIQFNVGTFPHIS